MSDIDLAPLQPVSTPLQATSGDLDRLTDVTVELAVEVGRTRMTLGQTLGLGPGAVVHLDHAADKPVDLLVNGRVIARGEVVVVDEEFGLRITEVVAPASSSPVVGEFAPTDLSEAA